MKTNPTESVMVAYILGELGPKERAAFEDSLIENPELEKELERLKSEMTGIADALGAEPVARLSQDQKTALTVASFRPTAKQRLFSLSRVGMYSFFAVLLVTLALRSFQKHLPQTVTKVFDGVNKRVESLMNAASQ